MTLKGRELINPDEQVIPDKDITIVFSYPLWEETQMKFHQDGGFTRAQLYDRIVKGYEEIYSAPTKYQVWGHGIDDLLVENVYYNPDTKTVELAIGS